jgi:hypothetical protein
MSNSDTYGDRLSRLLEEARAINRLGEDTVSHAASLAGVHRKEKDFEEAQQQKIEVTLSLMNHR